MASLRKFIHIGVSSLAMSLLVGSFYLQISNTKQVNASELQCGPASIITKPTPGAIVSGQTSLEAYIAPLTAESGNTPLLPTNVKFLIDNVVLGTASPISGTSLWGMPWNTTNFPNDGSVLIKARVSYPNSTTCDTLGLEVAIQNTDSGSNQGSLEMVSVYPADRTLSMITNFSEILRVRMVHTVNGESTNVSANTQFTWKTLNSIGKISNVTNGPAATFFSGPTAGKAEVEITGIYAGVTKKVKIVISVVPQSESTFPGVDETTANETNSGSSGSSGSSNVDDEQPSTSGSAAPIQDRIDDDSALKKCMVTALGEKVFNEIVNTGRRLTFAELDKTAKCFASSRYVIPANVAPINPGEIRDAKVDASKAKIKDIQQSTSEGDATGIVLSGTAIPNSQVLLYIFSEPLVLTTETDANGDWTYVLEDPLEPGEHEVYVAVEGEDGEAVRSSAFSFGVAQVAAIDSNPSGLSLTLDLSDPETNSVLYFVSAGVGVVLLFLGAYVVIIRHKSQTSGSEEKLLQDAAKVE